MLCVDLEGWERGEGRPQQGQETETWTSMHKADEQQGRQHGTGGLSNNAKWIYSIEMFNHYAMKLILQIKFTLKKSFYTFDLYCSFFYDFLNFSLFCIKL